MAEQIFLIGVRVMMGWGWGSGMMGTGFGLLFGLLMLVFWVVVIVGVVLLVVWLVRQGGRSYGAPPGPRGYGGPPMGGEDRALEILKQRYAKGEISKEEYDRMRQDLM